MRAFACASNFPYSFRVIGGIQLLSKLHRLIFMAAALLIVALLTFLSMKTVEQMFAEDGREGLHRSALVMADRL